MLQDPQKTAADELREIAHALETYRADIGMTKTVLLRTYPELGTDRTYNRIISGDFAELKIEEKWLPVFRHVWNQIQGTELEVTDGLIETMTGPAELCRSYLECKQERGTTARFILVLGDSAMGKTSAVQVMKSKPYGGLVLDVEAADAWRGKGRGGTAAPLLRAIGAKLGMKDLPSARDALLSEVVGKLNGQRRALVIEEVHHLCPQGLNTLKTLINMTPVIIIATGLPVLWDRLAGSREAWAECRQLTNNRLFERITLTLTEADVSSFLEARLKEISIAESDMDKAVTALTNAARTFGNLRFVDAVTKRFIREVKLDQPPTLDVFKNCILQEKKRR